MSLDSPVNTEIQLHQQSAFAEKNWQGVIEAMKHLVGQPQRPLADKLSVAIDPAFLDMGDSGGLYQSGSGAVAGKTPLSDSRDARELQSLMQYVTSGDLPGSRPHDHTSEQSLIAPIKHAPSSRSQSDVSTGGPQSHRPASPGVPDKDGGTVSVDAKGNKTTQYKDGAMRVENSDGTGYTLTPRPDGTFVQHCWYPAPEHFWQKDRNHEADKVLSGEQVLAQKKEALLADAKEHIKDPAALKAFQDNMQHFEERAKKDGLSAAQVAQTYQQVDTLLSAEGNKRANADERTTLAEQVISQAANPGKVRQGNYDTCGAADLEAATYARHPEAAARIVTDVALTGQYTALDGTEVHVDPKPQGESVAADGRSAKQEPGPEERSYASQLFQVATVNVAVTKHFKDDPTIANPFYYQDADGEGLQYQLKGDDTVYSDPNYLLTTADVTDAYQAIAGDGSMTVIRQSKEERPALEGQTPVVRSEDDLKKVLGHAKMPLLVLVNVDNEPFDQPAKDEHGRYQDRGDRGHYVLVTGYKAGPPATVEIYNTQGQGQPYGKGGEMAVHDLYLATLTRKDEIAALKKDVLEEQKSGHVQPWKKLEIVRLEVEDGAVSRAQAARELQKIMAQMPQEERQRRKELIRRTAEASHVDAGVLLAAGVEP